MNFLFPQICILCKAVTHSHLSICTLCKNELPWNDTCCVLCGNVLPTCEQLCGQCIESPPPFQKAIGVFKYQDPIRSWITRLKYQHQLRFAFLLAELMLEKIVIANQEMPQLIIPVPLHPKKMQARGFNQSIEIATILARRLKIPLSRTHLIRTKNTSSQYLLSATKRHISVQNAFKISERLNNTTHVAIIDDVMTTGSTVRELSLCLRKYTAVQKIEVWCCARAVRIQNGLRGTRPA